MHSEDHWEAHNVLQEGAKDLAGLLIDRTGEALDAAAASQSPDRGLSDAEESLLEGVLGVLPGTRPAKVFPVEFEFFPFPFAWHVRVK